MILKKKTLDFLVSFILLFNIIDIVVSVRFVKYGPYLESNPFMKSFLSMNSIMPFIFIKTFLICGGLYILYKRRNKPIARLGVYLCFSIYWALIVHFYYFLWIA